MYTPKGSNRAATSPMPALKRRPLPHMHTGESEAKQQKMFQKKPEHWIDWNQAQEARAKAERMYRTQKSAPLLRDWLLLSLQTCMPPDRIGVIRRLRLNMTLKRCGDGFVLDLTSARLHKSARFHGPSITTLSPMLNEPLNQYLALLQYDSVEVEAPYARIQAIELGTSHRDP